MPTKEIIIFEELYKNYDNINKTVTVLENKIREDQGKTVEEFKSERINIEEKIEILENSLNEYQFLESYKNIESDLINLTEKVNLKLRDYHSLNTKQKKIKDAYLNNESINLQEIKKLYNEVLSTFGNLVTKSLDDITKFKNEIIENRNKFLINKDLELLKNIDLILKEISALENERSKLYKKLEEKGALESIKNTYEMLTEEKTHLSKNLQVLGELDELQVELVNLNVKISEIKRDTINIIKKKEKHIKILRGQFLEILKNAIILENENSGGYFDIAIKPDSKRNQLPFKVEIEIPKADALGQSRLKIVAYDLMVFLRNIIEKRTFPHFLIHDGVFHGISLNTKIKALNYMYHKTLQYPEFQYIVTFNEDEIFLPIDKKHQVGEFDFKIDDLIIAYLSDENSEMLFKRDF